MVNSRVHDQAIKTQVEFAHGHDNGKWKSTKRSQFTSTHFIPGVNRGIWIGAEVTRMKREGACEAERRPAKEIKHSIFLRALEGYW